MAANKSALQRLQRELRALTKDPPPHVAAQPKPGNLHEWHYVLEGSPGTPYEGGLYHGKVLFPPDYPWKPPSIVMMTPSGRFTPSTPICMSMTNFHPESWNPMWSVGTILTGLLSFMCEESSGVGSLHATSEERKELARTSITFNLKNPSFRRLFPQYKSKSQERSSDGDEMEAVKRGHNGEGSSGTVGNVEGTEEGKAGALRGGDIGAGAVGNSDQGGMPAWALPLLVLLLSVLVALPVISSLRQH